jgi:hypothetical protein
VHSCRRGNSQLAAERRKNMRPIAGENPENLFSGRSSSFLGITTVTPCMLTAYFDDSGTHDSSDVVIIAQARAKDLINKGQA